MRRRHMMFTMALTGLLLVLAPAGWAQETVDGPTLDFPGDVFPDDPPGDDPGAQTPGTGPGESAIVQSLTVSLLSTYTFSELQDGVYVGSEFCIACHPSLATWRDTRHAQALRRPLSQYSLVAGKGVVADYDRNGVDDFMQGLNFNNISSAFDAYKPNAPILSYAAGVYSITIGSLTMPVVTTQGGTGEWKQRYLVRVPVAGTADGLSAENYVSPVQFNEKTYQYVTYHPEQWWDGSGTPLYGPGTTVAALAGSGRSYSKSCIGCHTTGTKNLAQDVNSEWRYTPYPAILFFSDDPGYFDYDHDGLYDIVNIGCEACHGPGSLHILGGGDPERIVNPAELSTAEANEVCGQCHLRGKSVPNGTHDWPYLDDSGTSFIPGQGEALNDYFTDASGRWPDGIHAKQHHQQWLDFIESPKPGFSFHPVKCVECHEPHGGTSNDRLIRDVLVEGGVAISTRTANNTLCLACHAGFGPFADLNKQTIADIGQQANYEAVARTVSAHTNHPYAPERRMGLSQCVDCHMPKVAKSAIDYDIRSHVFEAIPPGKTLAFQEEGGMPSSCAVSCHSLKVNTFGLRLDPNLSNWTESFDRATARQLERYFGPGGIWWDTEDGE